MKNSSHRFRSEEKVERCGVVGIWSKSGKNVAPALYKAMLALQHRGQDAAGFAIWNNGAFIEKKGVGLVSGIFSDDDLTVEGLVGVGHTRYPTTGLCLISDVQPFKNIGMAISHNGQISNYKVLRSAFEKKGVKFLSTVDSEVVVHSLRESLEQGKTIDEAVGHFMNTADGSYAISAVVDGQLIAFRDPNGIRPLLWGESKDFIIFASETVALDINGAEYRADVGCGEFAIVRGNHVETKRLNSRKSAICMFEYVYFARPDSTINGKNVMETRIALGVALANEHPAKADVVIYVPDSARSAASAYAKTLGMDYAEGLIKNRYIGRTFIMPSQQKRRDSVRMKLNVVRNVVGGRRVVLVDDSIVRGTTMREIVSLIKEGGAKEVHVRITCPPIRAPCFYGIDMSSYEELAAHRKSVEEICRFVGADSLGYLSVESLKKSIAQPICSGCLDEGYPTPYAKKLADEQKK